MEKKKLTFWMDINHKSRSSQQKPGDGVQFLKRAPESRQNRKAPDFECLASNLTKAQEAETLRTEHNYGKKDISELQRKIKTFP